MVWGLSWGGERHRRNRKPWTHVAVPYPSLEKASSSFSMFSRSGGPPNILTVSPFHFLWSKGED